MIEGGLEPLAVHLFILYWGMLSFITPPVALGAFAAASIAQAKPMAAAWDAMKMSVVIYFIPFLFVMEPALILSSGWLPALAELVVILPAIYLVAAGTQGWLPIIGNLPRSTAATLVAGGLLVALPDLAAVQINLSELWMDLAGAGLILVALGKAAVSRSSHS